MTPGKVPPRRSAGFLSADERSGARRQPDTARGASSFFCCEVWLSTAGTAPKCSRRDAYGPRSIAAGSRTTKVSAKKLEKRALGIAPVYIPFYILLGGSNILTQEPRRTRSPAAPRTEVCVHKKHGLTAFIQRRFDVPIPSRDNVADDDDDEDPDEGSADLWSPADNMYLDPRICDM
ncbi:hypothetical protein DFH09DRAFT_1096224 [Mycena vulgaris]|nr:hypothetical protein DFH09DRAFT_1096224 [Mycena vulgaris]